MRSLRTRITLMMLCVIFGVLTIITLVSTVYIRKTERIKSDQLLLLLCEIGERNLDYYFDSVQSSVEKVSYFAESDLKGTTDEQLRESIESVREYFDAIAHKTNGVVTYYYRIDPSVSETEKGFWYTNIDGAGFTEHEVTDITQFDVDDTSKLVWFTVPKFEGKPIWLPPYVTENIDLLVISYNVPIYFKDRFIGVVGIEIDYSTMVEQVDSIRIRDSGYAFLSDSEGQLFYHPHIDMTKLTPETAPGTPEGFVSDDTYLRYTFEGVKKRTAWVMLSNGMHLNVTMPASETEGNWMSLVKNIAIVSLELLLAASLFSMIYMRRITRPLEQLTEAAEQADNGNYDYILNYDKDDEVGRLTRSFRRMSSHMKDHISSLNKQVYVDALTHLKNKGAFSNYLDELQSQMDDGQIHVEFAICMFDCDDLKKVNDSYGHEKGDVYLNVAGRTICNVFKHSPVFRVGGDEFAVILQYEDYQDREELIKQFEKETARINDSAKDLWNQVHISMGLAAYDPETDSSATDVLRHADREMYNNKRLRKKGR
ncbi:MAG: diguanylate cyclase [Butyrivibrio sp.]|nr:diguanylate cyclase [Butyrivibrio sp.]